MREKVFNEICITKTASTINSLLGVESAEKMDSPISEVLAASESKFGKNGCDRVFIYNPDAIAMWIYDKYSYYFRNLDASVDLSLPMVSVYPPVNPVCFASMYSGLSPEGHGFQETEDPVLSVPTVFDTLPAAGKKVAIVSTEGDSISSIFLNRKVDYFFYKTKLECINKALDLIKDDKYDVIQLYNGDFDYWMHRVTPEGYLARKALRENIATYLELANAIKENWGNHNAVLGFCPEHGCHHSFPLPGNHGKNEPCDMNIMHFYKLFPRKV